MYFFIQNTNDSFLDKIIIERNARYRESLPDEGEQYVDFTSWGLIDPIQIKPVLSIPTAAKRLSTKRDEMHHTDKGYLP